MNNLLDFDCNPKVDFFACQNDLFLTCDSKTLKWAHQNTCPYKDCTLSPVYGPMCKDNSFSTVATTSNIMQPSTGSLPPMTGSLPTEENTLSKGSSSPLGLALGLTIGTFCMIAIGVYTLRNQVKSVVRRLSATHDPLLLKHIVYMAYEPKACDELALHINDIISLTVIFDDGWAMGRNETTNKSGMLPVGFIRPLET